MKDAEDITDPNPNDAVFLRVLSLDGMVHVNIATRKESFKLLYLSHMNNLPLTHIEGIEFRFEEPLHEVIESFNE